LRDHLELPLGRGIGGPTKTYNKTCISCELMAMKDVTIVVMVGCGGKEVIVISSPGKLIG
jgi:hypothetical protein